MKCDQEKCIFNMVGVGCRACEVCGEKPYEINDNCDKCYNCKSDEGLLRWNDNSDGETEEEAEALIETEKEQVIEVTAK